METTTVLVPALWLLSSIYTQQWGVTFGPGLLSGSFGSCVTIPCSYTYPMWRTVTAVQWTLERDKIVYHSHKDSIHPLFQGRAHYLGDLKKNCSLRLDWLRSSDQGTYRFRFETESTFSFKRDGWTSEPGQFLFVSASSCQPSLESRMEPGPNLTCSVQRNCPLHPSWYGPDGVWRSPEQTPARTQVTELPISPSQLLSGMALRCQVDGYQDKCISNQSQPLGPVSPNVPSIKVLQPRWKTAIKEGNGFMLQCQGGALLPITKYVWSRGDNWLPGAEQDLRIHKADVSDGGNYSCGVWISGPGWAYLSLSARELVQVQHAPKGVNITAMPRTVLAEGDLVKLMCHFSSSIPAVITYAWYKDRTSLRVSRAELALQGVTAMDTGEYLCEVQNQVGKARSSPVTIKVIPRAWPHTNTIGVAVAVVLLLMGLAVIIAWRRWRKYQGMDNSISQRDPGEAPTSECVYENTQHRGMEKLACQSPPKPPSPSTEQYQEPPHDVDPSHIYSQPNENGKEPQADPNEVYYSAIQLHHSTQRVEPASDTACVYAEIKR